MVMDLPVSTLLLELVNTGKESRFHVIALRNTTAQTFNLILKFL